VADKINIVTVATVAAAAYFKPSMQYLLYAPSPLPDFDA
jgi:hypothetical protein